jgi:DNA-binding SARP family transcriptional activator
VTDLELRVLGPVAVRRGGLEVALGGRTTLNVLAGLALSPERAIGVHTLIDYVWDGDFPAHPRAALHNGLSRLRRLLGDGLIETLGWAYRLHVSADSLDLLRFDQHLIVARQTAADGRDEDSIAALDAAIRLWREPPLGNVDSPVLHRQVVPRLTERYLEAVERRSELCLRLGRHDTLAEELSEVARSHPLRERITGQLMIALTRSGRRADALVAYHALRSALREELGVDPTGDLQDLHLQILRAAPELEPRSRMILA